MSKKFRKCLLDMDGVIVDFHAGVKHLFSIPESKFQEAEKPLAWDWVWNYTGLSVTEFWSKIQEEFWINLPWTQDGWKILSAVEQYFGPENVCLLSNPSGLHSAVVGKMIWIEKHLSDYHKKGRYLFGGAKQFAANPSHLLVDDSDANVKDFTDAGGSVFLTPRMWNSQHHIEDVARHLQEFLDGSNHAKRREFLPN